MNFFLLCYDFFNIQDSFFLLNQNPSEKSDVIRNTNCSVLYFILCLHQEADKAVLESILPIAPNTGLKRQFPNDLKDAHDVTDAPGKVPKKGQWAVLSWGVWLQSDRVLPNIQYILKNFYTV